MSTIDIDAILRQEARHRMLRHTNKEIARQTGLTPKQVSNRLRRFVRELAKCSTLPTGPLEPEKNQ
jgi:DNA-binding Lrp family transcriptional regulator